MRSCSRSLAGVCATVRLGFAGRRPWRGGLEPAHIAAGRKRQAQRTAAPAQPKGGGPSFLRAVLHAPSNQPLDHDPTEIVISSLFCT